MRISIYRKELRTQQSQDLKLGLLCLISSLTTRLTFFGTQGRENKKDINISDG